MNYAIRSPSHHRNLCHYREGEWKSQMSFLINTTTRSSNITQITQFRFFFLFHRSPKLKIATQGKCLTPSGSEKRWKTFPQIIPPGGRRRRMNESKIFTAHQHRRALLLSRKKSRSGAGTELHMPSSVTENELGNGNVYLMKTDKLPVEIFQLTWHSGSGRHVAQMWVCEVLLD